MSKAKTVNRHAPHPARGLSPSLRNMLWDNDSDSSSPTSVKTPDGENFEAELLDPDVRNFFNAAMNESTRVSYNAIPVVDQSIFTPQNTFSDHSMLSSLLCHLFTNQNSYQCSSRRGSGVLCTTVSDQVYGSSSARTPVTDRSIAMPANDPTCTQM